mgnify:CR=1 FL=1
MNIQFVENVYAISGSILRPFKGLFKIFKGSADDVIKNSGKVKITTKTSNDFIQITLMSEIFLFQD